MPAQGIGEDVLRSVQSCPTPRCGHRRKQAARAEHRLASRTETVSHQSSEESGCDHGEDVCVHACANIHRSYWFWPESAGCIYINYRLIVGGRERERARVHSVIRRSIKSMR